jgi:hypothetical protein
LKCGAVVSVEAGALGVKVPVRRWPFAWAGGVCQLVVFETKTGGKHLGVNGGLCQQQ